MLEIDNHIGKVKDFPIKGILFYDISPLLADPTAFEDACSRLEHEIQRVGNVQKIVAVDARGFVFGAAVARSLKLPLILSRKKGKLPGQTVSVEYKLEYGSASLEVQNTAIGKGERVVIIDDLIATGGTLSAVGELVEKCGGEIVEYLGIIGLPDLGYQKNLKEPVFTLINYQGV